MSELGQSPYYTGCNRINTRKVFAGSRLLTEPRLVDLEKDDTDCSMSRLRLLCYVEEIDSNNVQGDWG